MAITDIFKRKKVEVPTEERSYGMGLGFNGLSSYQTSQSMRLSAVYAATNMISNSCAILPIRIVKNVGDRKETIEHPLYQVLNLAPNPKYSHFNFMKLLIESVILNGNGYAYIERDENLNVKALHLLDATNVQPMLQADGSVKYIVRGMSKAVDAINMIHLYQHIDNQFNGISTIKYADMALRGAYDAEKHSDDFFKSGAGLMGVLKASAPLTKEQKTQIAESWHNSISSAMGGGVAILPQGLDFQSISISPEDSQLLETRKYNVVEIARFFNISPVKLFDFSKVSYNSLEQSSLSYLQDTILPITKLLSDEFNRKLFKPSELGKVGVDFDFSALIATDKQTEANYYKELLVNGVLSINDVRNKLGFLPLTDEEGGNAHFIQISYGTVSNVVDGAYIKQTAQDQNQQVDNQAKSNNKKNTEE